MINIYGWVWVFVFFFLYLEGETKRNKTNSLLLLLVCFLAGEMAFELIWSIWETQRVRLIQQAPLIHALSAPQEAVLQPQPQPQLQYQFESGIGTQTQALNPCPPASIEILAPNANASTRPYHCANINTMLKL